MKTVNTKSVMSRRDAEQRDADAAAVVVVYLY